MVTMGRNLAELAEKYHDNKPVRFDEGQNSVCPLSLYLNI